MKINNKIKHFVEKFQHKQTAGKKFVQAEKSPPPPDHVSNGPPLKTRGNTKFDQIDEERELILII
jgi:hypothetical protein